MMFPYALTFFIGVRGLGLAAILALFGPVQQPPSQTAGSDVAAGLPQKLELGKPLSHTIRGGESQDYQFALEAGQYARVLIDQKSVDIAVAALGADGQQIFAANVTTPGELESASLIGSATGTYRIRVQAEDKTAPAGEYEIKLVELQLATETHQSRVAAERARAAGMAMYHQQTTDAIRGAISKYQEALDHWRAAGDAKEESATLSAIGLFYRDLGEKQKALDFMTQGLQAARAAGDQIGEAWALDDIGSVQENFGDKKQAIGSFEQALSLWRATRHLAGELSTLNGLGMTYFSLGEGEKALQYFERAVVICHQFHNPSDEAVLLNNLAMTHGFLGDYRKELELENSSLAIHRQTGNRIGEAQALTNIGFSYSNLSEYQQAMDAYMAAVSIAHELGIPQDEAVRLNNIAWVYSTIGDQENAVKYYGQSLQIFRRLDDPWRMPQALVNLGAAYAELHQYQKARELYQEALLVHRKSGNQSGEANALKNLAFAHWKLADREKALDYYRQAEGIFRTGSDQRLFAQTLRSLGELSSEMGDRQKAMAYLSEALQVSRSIGDRRDEAESLGEIAHLELGQGEIEGARKHCDEALGIFDSLRSTITNPSLRAWFSHAGRKVYEVNLQALLRQNQMHPNAGYDAAAVVAMEKARARSLLELLGESQARIREGVDPALLDREVSLRRAIARKAQQQELLLSGKHTDEQAAKSAKELDALTSDYDQLQSAIRKQSPAYAALTIPIPLSLAEIQKSVLDEETLLLEYTLGEEKSFLFAVTSQSIDVFELPKREMVESAARRVYDLLTERNRTMASETPQQRVHRVRRAEAEYPEAATELSRMLLGPVAVPLGKKRLLIVAEGALQYVPFAALPDPLAKLPGKAQPLIAGHEIVTAPSASVLSLIRSEASHRQPAEKLLAVLADPVFERLDPRVTQHQTGAPMPSATANEPAEVTRSGAESGLQHFDRLRFSRREAEQIARFVQAPEKFTALDFAASRSTATSAELAQYRIVHFATHGIINNIRPELSGLVLSLVNEKGEPVDGFLRLYDIYNLRLGADLVVLSACQTALGKEMAGEGLVGLTRGFVYAGAPRVVATLWQIDDRVTAELMANFYRAMLTRGERPAAALRAAQLAMWNTKGWESPYYWAAFTLQGEWK